MPYLVDPNTGVELAESGRAVSGSCPKRYATDCMLLPLGVKYREAVIFREVL